MPDRVLIVGASLAGVRTAEALRRCGHAGEVLLVGAEPGSDEGVAADRPPLSKAFLADPRTPAPPLTSRARLAELDVRLVTGRAVDVDLGCGSVAVHGGKGLPFDVLVVATGSTPRTVPGLEPRPGVHALRTAADAAAIRAAAAQARRVVVVGGGFIGTEVAWTLHALGRDVAIVEPLPTLMVRGLGARIGAAITRRHAAAGIDLRLGAGVAGVDGGDQVEAVQLTDGTRLPADLVVLGLGTAPETEWLAGSGLDLRDGVVCDERLRARGAEQVYAVGDVARWWHPRYGENIRVEHWSNAIDTAAVAAANITGTRTVHDALPYVWSEQLDGRLQIFGRVQTGDDVRVVHGDLEGDFVAVTGSASRPGAAVGIGAVRPLVRVRKLLAAGAGWEEVLAGG